jgi:uncharacterized protein YbgA (DUF1722 family)/uncharacterized protein YbbK (DUF523 family)
MSIKKTAPNVENQTREMTFLPRAADDRPLRVGISRCLLGDSVRYDGGHKRDGFLADLLSQYVEWVPVCPEVELGLGTPREAMRLSGRSDAPHLITIKTCVDHTSAMQRFAKRRVRELKSLDLSGYIFKKDSPSCGVERVRVYHSQGAPARNGRGLFAQAFIDALPLIPVEEEGRLQDPALRENFIERIFAYGRWRNLERHLSRQAVVEFHSRHKYLLLAHSRPHYQTLGRLVAEAGHYAPSELARRYGVEFMNALEVKATVRKHVNVLQHMIGYFKDRLTKAQSSGLQEVVADYHRGLTPLIVPLTLVKHYAAVFEVPYVQNQVYLAPHPKELMLRNSMDPRALRI